MILGLFSTLIAAHLLVGGYAMNWKHPGSRRGQYYVLHGDGSYKFGYDTGTGSSAQASADPANEVQGEYSYDSPVGLFALKYTAGVAGYLPVIDSAGSSAQEYTGGAASPGEDSADNVHSTFTYSSSDGGQEKAEDQSAAEKAPIENSSSDEGSTATAASEGSTAVEAGSSAAEAVAEVAAADTAADEAQAATGAAAADVQSSSGTEFGSYSFSYDAGDHSREESSDARGNVKGRFSFRTNGDSVTRTVEYEAGAGTGFVARGTHLPKAPQVPALVSQTAYAGTGSVSSSSRAGSIPSVSRSNDGSYSFSYDAGDHSREESADASGNVRGSFSFVGKGDGVRRKVEYEAGADKGFVARGDHIKSQIAASAASVKAAVQTQTQTAAVSENAGGAIVSSFSPSTTGDASYSFNYDAGDHSREESSDASGNVRGSFSFVSKGDGVRRRVQYRAGAASGFVATGDHLPRATALERAAAQTDAGGDDSTSSAVDGSYDFAYDAGDHSRQESSDARGNVRGSYSFVSKDDGVRRRVDYSAGAGTGFRARGGHLPAANVDAALSPEASTQVEASTGEGGSYSFSYDAGDHSRQESADGAGKVKGSFSYKSEGVSRRVEYEAGSGTGFLARGDHLPTPPAPVEAPAVVEGEAAGDASYSYNYDTDTGNKEGGTDSAGNAVGKFSYVAGDGVSRNGEYASTGGEGFVVTGQVVATAVPVVYTGDSSHHSHYHHALIDTYLAPNGHNKFGYIYDTIH